MVKSDKKRVVIKVGTNVLTNKDNRIVRPIITDIVRQIAKLYEQDILSVLISSGSVIAGKEVLGNCDITDKAIRRQVFSSVGQPRMMRTYYETFHDYGMKCAQVLATKRDFNPGVWRENMINCYEGLLAEGIIPIANEDDATSVSNTMFTDNDELASLVAELIGADMLIILTDTHGFYNGHPDDDDTRIIREVSVDDEISQFIRESGKADGEGRGGMGSKVKVAQDTAAKDITVYIANGKRDNVILDIVDGKTVGTKFVS
ncbi:glutamate 5-kinase [Roseivirga pacifica]|uniref:glutamate 5-kinase n=1 Tax=Roseivirga pacifica TaxID=1267423 RepID=UPI0020945FFD|nr:glutamate 5-kinase [Roseivirga pacifica]MCO6360684.1 glutamate 5-kinase [Roseivirga pacifica]MCO6368573.1 glutamate 5-kinase [Roseivirga pacifica]MCO6372715.1 glutamate 5-kinase [Roseivirga pacifica]MCO6376773.1 glutamate 5-kinase [Roseivirga pacifica]MCO6377947.1 glutamate 5-kinase [Roseivirga pacifica]